ncbi:hypothetical protein OG389_20455 [Streptomyces sp. NBC_00435]|uniref:hypothetical protein n=1 Tax=Streptomyces sp. NBC_00435 TaxID=2903649 RepID=UPI002E1B4198
MAVGEGLPSGHGVGTIASSAAYADGLSGEDIHAFLALRILGVIPAAGGGEESDASREAALHRETHEEIAGKAVIVRLLHTMESDEERQVFHLARIGTWSFEDHSGTEFSAEGRGEYALAEIPLTAQGLDGIELKPEEIAHVLRDSSMPANSRPGPCSSLGILRRRVSDMGDTLRGVPGLLAVHGSDQVLRVPQDK